jgi:uncharacterized protein DUF5320
MPGGDGSGPMGQGAQTGRGQGSCPPAAGARRTFFGFGGGFGRGRGPANNPGRGRGKGFGLRRMWPWGAQSINEEAGKE